MSRYNFVLRLRRVLNGRDGEYFSHWEGDRKGCSAAFSFTAGFDDSTVKFDEVPSDREAESESAGGPAAHRLGLPETIEDVRQKLRAYAFSRINDREPGLTLRILQLQPHQATGGRELHSV